MHFRILKMIATSGFLAALDYTPNSFLAGAPPRAPLWELTALPRPYKDPTSKGRKGKGWKRRKEIGKGRRRKRKGGKGKGVEKGKKGEWKESRNIPSINSFV